MKLPCGRGRVKTLSRFDFPSANAGPHVASLPSRSLPATHETHPSLLSMSSRASTAPERAVFAPNSSPSHTAPGGDNAAAHRFLPALVVLFIGSGCAALIYEIVWFQMLSLIVGSSALSLGVILGTFMGGMCIGSIWLSKVNSRRHHPLRV